MARSRSDQASATPLMSQAEEADCGPVCLGIVLAYRGVRVSLATLRSACGVSRDGSTAADLVRVAVAHGLDARGVRIRTPAAPETVLGALRKLDLPAIVVLRGSHFVVVERVGDDDVAINDPAHGRDVRSAAEFLAEFSGVALTVAGKSATGESARPVRPRRRPWAQTCTSWLAPARATVALVVLAGLGLGLLTAAEAMLLARAGTLVVAGQHDRVWLLAAAAAGVALIAAALALGQRRLLNAVPVVVSARQSRGLLETILTVPGSFVRRRPLAALMTQIRFVDTASVLLAHRVVPLFSSVALVLPVGIALGLLCAPVLGIAAAGAAVATALRAAGDRRTADARRLLTGESVRRSGLAHAALSRRAAMHAEASDADLFAELSVGQESDRRSRDVVAAQLRPWHSAATTVELVASVGSCGIVVALAFAGGSPSAIGALALVGPFLMHTRFALDMVRELPGFIGRFAVLDDLLAALPESRYRVPAGPDTGRLCGRIALADVAVGYAENRSPLLEGVSLRIEPGRRVVVRGAAGAGSSALLKLVAGGLEPLRGQVLLDGRPIREIPRAVLRRSLGYVPQVPCLFPGTVADNVTLFDDAVPDDAITRALRDACLGDMIARRGGPRTAVVASAGRNLSAGERWRLALARALVHDPSILVLDEPASALDPALAARIDGALRRRGATTVLATRDPGFAGPHDTVLTLAGARLVSRAVPHAAEHAAARCR